jgi:hypothetical protein
MTIRTSRRFVLATAIAMLAIGGMARAAETTPPVPADPTPAQRQEMAAIHRKMAECLASERPFAECRAEMHASCQTTLGAHGCPMMQGGGMGPGMMGGRGMHHGGGMMPGTAPSKDGATP